MAGFINLKINFIDNEIKLLKNNDSRTDSDIEKVREFYCFLTGEEMQVGKPLLIKDKECPKTK